MGNRWGAGRENGEGKGRGRSVYKQPGTRVDRDAPHTKEGFQVSERDMGTEEGSPGKKGNYQRDSSRGLCIRVQRFLKLNKSPVSVAR